MKETEGERENVVHWGEKANVNGGRMIQALKTKPVCKMEQKKSRERGRGN